MRTGGPHKADIAHTTYTFTHTHRHTHARTRTHTHHAMVAWLVLCAGATFMIPIHAPDRYFSIFRARFSLFRARFFRALFRSERPTK